MRIIFASGRKTALAFISAGLLGATALTSSFVLSPPLGVRAQTQLSQPIDPSKGFADLADRVMPAVVSVEVKYANTAASEDDEDGDGLNAQPDLPEFFKQFPQFRDKLPPQMRRGRRHGGEGGGMALGSGFIISADGYAVTNNHVVKDAVEVTVHTKDGEEFKAKVIGSDARTDLALIKIESNNKPFQYVSFAKKEARVGDWVMAVGNPFGLGGTVTTGIVSARGRDIGSGSLNDFLQIDASINKGNSGGPAFNMEGEVIGVNTAIFSPSGGSVGIGFAVPASTTQEVVDSLKQDGKVSRGWLGVQIQPVTSDIADSLGLKDLKGAIVSDVTPKSPALVAGIEAGDTIIAVGDETVKDSRDLARKVAHYAPGKDVAFKIMRHGKEMTLDVKLGAAPKDPQMASAGGDDEQKELSKPSSLASLGLKLAPADDGAGAKIVAVEPGSAADQQGLKPGDVVVQVGGIDVNNPSDVKRAVGEVHKSKVLMLVRTTDGQRFLALPIKKG